MKKKREKRMVEKHDYWRIAGMRREKGRKKKEGHFEGIIAGIRYC